MLHREMRDRAAQNHSFPTLAEARTDNRRYQRFNVGRERWHRIGFFAGLLVTFLNALFTFSPIGLNAHEWLRQHINLSRYRNVGNDAYNFIPTLAVEILASVLVWFVTYMIVTILGEKSLMGQSGASEEALLRRHAQAPQLPPTGEQELASRSMIPPGGTSHVPGATGFPKVQTLRPTVKV